MFRIFIYIFLLGVSTVNAQEKADGLIWKKNVLTWAYFQEVEHIPGDEHPLARIYTKLHMVPGDTISQIDTIEGVRVQVYALMIPSLSQVRTSANRRGVLEHEQIHFDQVELFARRLRKQLAETWVTRKNYKKEIRKIFRELATGLQQSQRLYDKQHRQAEHGHNWWRASLDTQLEQLGDYSDIDVFVRVK